MINNGVNKCPYCNIPGYTIRRWILITIFFSPQNLAILQNIYMMILSEIQLLEINMVIHMLCF